MITGRPASPHGKPRVCPHCKATILASSSVCPACRHHLQFSPAADKRAKGVPLHVEGVVRHPSAGEPWEYSVVVAVRNEKGEEIARHVVGVGALQPMEARTFSLSVEVFGEPESVRANMPLSDSLEATPEVAVPAAAKSSVTPSSTVRPDSRAYRPVPPPTAPSGPRTINNGPLPPLNPPGLRPGPRK